MLVCAQATSGRVWASVLVAAVQDLCYSEYWQMAYLASQAGSAAALFVGGSYAQPPVTAGPTYIAEDFLMPAFS